MALAHLQSDVQAGGTGTYAIGAGSDRLLVVMHRRDALSRPSSYTWGGRSFTQFGSALDFTVSNSIRISCWYLLEADIALAVGDSWGGSGVTIGDRSVVVLKGANQGTPLRDFDGNMQASTIDPCSVVSASSLSGDLIIFNALSPAGINFAPASVGAFTVGGGPETNMRMFYGSAGADGATYSVTGFVPDVPAIRQVAAGVIAVSGAGSGVSSRIRTTRRRLRALP